MLPSPGWLSTRMCPPIKLTSRCEMAKPRPVPPNRRVVEESAWVNGAKIVSNFSAAMPMPVSETEKCKSQTDRGLGIGD